MGEKKQIRIAVKDKIACLVDKEQFLVCGNNDYEVVFDFDSDWEGISVKTAVFVYGNTPIHQPFVGNVCEGVEIKNATLCAIGVFAGDIKTTTGATIECRQSIRDIGGVPKPPSKEVYDEIMALLDKAIEAHTELPTGGKKGQVLKKVSDKDYDTEWANDEQRDLSEIEEKIESLNNSVSENAKNISVKLDKTDQANKIYGTNAKGEQIKLPYSQSLYGNGIVCRDPNSNIFVPEIPLNSVYSATSKGYVDKKHNEIKTQTEALEERVSDLESLTLTFTEDKTVAYNKSVPANVGKYARIKSVGGASKASDNICDPRSLTSKEEITVNADNSITFDVAANGMTSINLPTLPKGTYYCVVETNTNITVNPYTSEGGVATNNHFEITSDTDNFYFEFENIDWSGGETEPVTVTAKIAVFKGSTERGYVPFFSGFKNAEVSKIESRGANLIPFPYVYGVKVMDVGYKETIKGVTFEVLENGLISAVGTATEQATFLFSRATMPAGNYYLGGTMPKGGLVVVNYDGGTKGCGALNQKIAHSGGIIQVYVRVESGVTVNDTFASILTKDYYVKDYKPYKAEPIDTFTIPVEAIKARVDGFGVGKNYIQWTDDKVEFVQMKKQAILNSKIAWGFYPNQTTSGAYVYYSGEFKKKIGYQTSRCSEFENVDGVWGFGTSGQYGDHSTTNIIYMCSNLATLDEWKAWLDKKETEGNPIILEYELATPIVTDITDLFTNGYKIQVEQGGTLIPVNENELPVPTTIAYVTRKG